MRLGSLVEFGAERLGHAVGEVGEVSLGALELAEHLRRDRIDQVRIARGGGVDNVFVIVPVAPKKWGDGHPAFTLCRSLDVVLHSRNERGFALQYDFGRGIQGPLRNRSARVLPVGRRRNRDRHHAPVDTR